MNRTTNILLWVWLTTLLTACIREDRSDCNDTIIHVDYIADGVESVLKEYVEDVNLFILSANSFALTELGNWEIRVNLDKGSYYLVTVANAQKHTRIIEGENDQREEFYLQHPQWQKPGDVIETHEWFVGFLYDIFTWFYW